MNIAITFRHLEPSEAIKRHTRSKVSKLQRFLRQPMSARVTLSLDKLEHVAEARVSSGGEHHEAKESSEDLYASVDKVIAKLERQIRGAKGAQRAKKRRTGGTRSAVAAGKKSNSRKKSTKKKSASKKAR